ncbi:hypothetical protein [Blastococcus atacamensis]|uniref:hypothetical protein n=1 Tax=Blastococcus atacamensis TaxID=2070508 RepID=UPI000CECBD5D|nr:hypothetical protein [Blastococcus atacamensis]
MAAAVATLPVLAALLALLPTAARRPALSRPAVRAAIPAPAVVAGVLAFLSGGFSLMVSLIALLTRLFAVRSSETAEPATLAVLRAVVLGVVVVGALMLLLGRSWLVLAVAAAADAVLSVVAGRHDLALVIGDALLPAVLAVLASLPSVRRWVAVQRGRAPTARGRDRS